MESKQEFNSEFSNVKYIEDNNVVFLTWKKFCCFEDYREPTTFALQLLRKFSNSNLVVDARNGFEDMKEDVEWGFSVLIPEMAKTDCKYVVFIMNEKQNIDEEIDLWTKEFGKYFGVCKVNSYDGAIDALHKELLMHVTYRVKAGKRDEFIKKVKELGIIVASKQEPGNLFYEYYYPIGDENSILLIESWINTNAQVMHGKTEHFKMLSELKNEYVEKVTIKKFVVSDTM